MSVIGIDFGSESCYVAVARAGGIETIDNDYSLRATPSCVAFGEKQRIIGVAAKNQLVTNIRNTIIGFKRLMGREFNDPVVQEVAACSPFKIVKHPETNGPAFEVRYLDKVSVFTVEQITAMLFTKLKETAEIAVKAKVFDCVISVPSYFTNAERRALLSAAEVAGLNVLKVMNETTATALTYGIYKQDLPPPEEKPRNVVFVDCGYSSLQVSACAFNKGKLKMLASTADPFLGGRDFDTLLAKHFCQDFKQRYNMDPQSNHRAYVRLTAEVERIKKQMSANATKLPLNIECFMDDKDVTGTMNRADFENMSADLFSRVEKTFLSCLDSSKLDPSEIHSVEIVGGSSRIPAIKQLIEKVFGRAPSTTLNQDEAVARGCALQCAILSPVYKVRDFSVTDVQPYPINLIFDSTPDGVTEVFPRFHPVPFTRMISFHKRGIALRAEYVPPVPFPNLTIGTYSVDDSALNTENPLKIKVKAKININGIFDIVSATAHEKLTVEQAEEMETEPPATVTANDGNGDNSQVNAEAPAQNAVDGEVGQDVPMSQDEQQPVAEGEKKKKVQTKSTELPVIAQVQCLSKSYVEKLTELEGNMRAEDRKEKDRIDAKNALEEYVYHLREKLESDYVNYVTPANKTQFYDRLSEIENWLYEDGSEESRHEYSQRLDKLKQAADPIRTRAEEFQRRPDVIKAFDVSIQLGRKVVDMYEANEERYSHLTPEEVDTLKKAIQNSQKWLDDVRHAMLSWSQCDDPAITCADIESHRKQFESEAHPVTQKPVPKKAAPPPPEPTPTPNSTDGNANAQGNSDTNAQPPTNEPAPEPAQPTTTDPNNPMDLD